MAQVAVKVNGQKAIARKSTRHNRAVSFNEYEQKPCGVACELRLISVDDVNELFHVAIMIHTHFRTSSIKPDPSAMDEFVRDDSYKGFIPEIVMVNTVDQQYSSWATTPRINRNTGDVWVSFQNTFKINEALELETFPFDRQLFHVSFKSANAALDVWGLDTDILDFPESAKEEERFAPYLVSCELNTWKMTGVTAGLSAEDADPVSLTASEFEIIIMAERDPIFFLKNFVFVLYLIVATNACNISLVPIDVNARMSLSMTLLLTATAFKFTLAQALPKVGYSTHMDTYVLLSFLFLMFGILENVIVAPRVRCLDTTMAGDGSAACINDFLQDTDGWSTFDAWFQVVYLLSWTGIFLIFTLFSYVPSLIRPSWTFVLDNQVGDTESTMKRAVYVQDMDGDHEGHYRKPIAMSL